MNKANVEFCSSSSFIKFLVKLDNEKHDHLYVHDNKFW